jgi:hypothetical protein
MREKERKRNEKRGQSITLFFNLYVCSSCRFDGKSPDPCLHPWNGPTADLGQQQQLQSWQQLLQRQKT